MAFSTLQFDSSKDGKDSSIINTDTRIKCKSKKGLKNLLEKAETKKQRLAELQNTEDGKSVADNAKWGGLMKRVTGAKVEKDDIKLLKKVNNTQY